MPFARSRPPPPPCRTGYSQRASPTCCLAKRGASRSMRRSAARPVCGYGYELVIPPLIEYVESLLIGRGSDLDLRTFKLVDQASGRMLGVRADTTPQVARIDAHILNRPGAARLCYAGSVLHARPQPRARGARAAPGRRRTVWHVGLGGGHRRCSSSRCCRCALSRHRSGCTSISAIRAWCAGCWRGYRRQLSRERGHRARGAQRQGQPALHAGGRRAAGGDSQTRCCAARRLSGGVDVLGEARGGCRAGPPSSAALDALRASPRRCGADRVSIDLADLLGYRYQTGVSFAAYSLGCRARCCAAVATTTSAKAFGRARPATGFSDLPARTCRDCPAANGAARSWRRRGDDASLAHSCPGTARAGRGGRSAAAGRRRRADRAT